MRAAMFFANIEIRGKAGTVLNGNRPTDVYRIWSYSGEGTLRLDHATCLPVLLSVSDEVENHKRKSSIAAEWNIPVTITPPGP